jgi:hypothetical protein
MHLFGGLQCSVNRVPFYSLQDLSCYLSIYTQPTKGNAHALSAID